MTLTKTYNPIYPMKLIIYTGVSLYKMGGACKITLIALTASFLTPFLDSLKKYLLPNMDSLAIFTILLVLDVASGLFKHSGIWDKDAPNTLNKDEFFFKLLKKIFASAVWLVLVNAVEKYTADNAKVGEYLDLFGMSVLIAWLVWSIAENLSVSTKGEFPPTGWLKRLRRVKDTGDIKQINNTENDEVN